MRTDDPPSRPHGALQDAPEDIYAPAPASRRSRVAASSDTGFDEGFSDEDFDSRRQRGGYRVRFQGRVLQIPKTLWGRIASGLGLLVLAGCLIAAYLETRSFFLHDSRFVIASSSSIQTVGNTHLTRAQLLSVFGEDVERNIFRVPLPERRAELESLPWVQHATVMRLLPNHLRIAIVERTPVAFVDGQVGLVDANGVILAIPSDSAADTHYSFPIVHGITPDDPPSTRAARMRLFTDFCFDLDSTGQHISAKLSEVDLSNPEDVRSIFVDSPNVLVHFGDADFLARYQRFEQHMPEWRAQYPQLASVDMRYDSKIVLDMQPGATTATDQPPAAAPPIPIGTTAVASLKPLPLPRPDRIKPVAKLLAKPAVKSKPRPKAASNAGDSSDPAEWRMVVVKPRSKPAASPKSPAPAPPAGPREAGPQ